MRCLNSMERYRFIDENYSTNSSIQQENVEQNVDYLFWKYIENKDCNETIFDVKLHTGYLNSCLLSLPSNFENFDSSRVWLCYWILHANYLLGNSFDSETVSAAIRFLKSCQSETGGFSGGPGQYAHMATTYAAINAVCLLQNEEAYRLVDRKKLKDFLWSHKQPNGSFTMHVGGECDIRGVYCALSISKLMNIFSLELFENTFEWCISCQTYEGGFSGCPDLEAHGGYTFCGLATLIFLQKGHMCDIRSLLKWLVNKQKSFEGGFCGRTNKVVDSCYSFWVGAAFPLIHTLLSNQSDEVPHKLLYHEEALQEYLLICCQYVSGGMIDKPNKKPDPYHTCYALSGLSISQLTLDNQTNILEKNNIMLKNTHPLYNVPPELVLKAFNYFADNPIV